MWVLLKEYHLCNTKYLDIKYYKVSWYKVGRRSIVRAARAPQPPTNQPTNRAAIEQFAQKWSEIHILAKMAISATNILTFTRLSKFCYISENYIVTSLALFLVGRGIKWARKTNIWPRMPIFGQIWLFRAKNPKFLGKFWGNVKYVTTLSLSCIFATLAEI